LKNIPDVVGRINLDKKQATLTKKTESQTNRRKRKRTDFHSTSTLVVWGAGGFNPLSKPQHPTNACDTSYLDICPPIVMGTEYNTSKLSCCCHAEMTKLVKKDYKKRATVFLGDARPLGDAPLQVQGLSAGILRRNCNLFCRLLTGRYD
jgi:hypothetical protein